MEAAVTALLDNKKEMGGPAAPPRIAPPSGRRKRTATTTNASRTIFEDDANYDEDEEEEDAREKGGGDGDDAGGGKDGVVRVGEGEEGGAGEFDGARWEKLEGIPLGNVGAKMMVTFGDGRKPTFKAVEVALLVRVATQKWYACEEGVMTLPAAVSEGKGAR